MTGGRRGAGLALAMLAAMAVPAAAQIHTSMPQLLPIPGLTEPPLAAAAPSPAPIPPPVNPGYAAAPSAGLSPILTTPGPVYQLPQPTPPAYPTPPLPGPTDQQKLTAYGNELRAQQWQLQSQGIPLGSTVRGREILQQLNAPDAQ